MSETKQYANEVEAVKAGAERFPWGRIIEWHNLGEYDIAEYHPYDEKPNRDLFLNRERVAFHGWINGRDAMHGWDTLERAIVGLIAIKHEGPNTQAGELFARMVRLP